MTRVHNRAYGTISENARYVPEAFGREPQNVADVLESAACVLEEEGRWVQGYWFNHDNIRHPEYNENPYCNGWTACADGALQIVSVGLFRYLGPEDNPLPEDSKSLWLNSGSGYSEVEEVAPMWELYVNAVDVMRETVRTELKLSPWDPAGIVGFNDAPGRTRTEVVEMMRKAAANARAADTQTHAASTAPA